MAFICFPEYQCGSFDALATKTEMEFAGRIREYTAQIPNSN